MECHREDEWSAERPADRESEIRISALALRYRSGDLAALRELHAELAPSIAKAIRPHVTGPGCLPSVVAAEDLYQQAYVELAETVLDWDPARSKNFMPYFLGSFPWRIDHYLRSQTPARRTTRLRMLDAPHDLLMDRIAENPGHDGRDWDFTLVFAESLRELPEQCRQVLGLHLFQGLSFNQIARRMGIARSTAHDVFKRAIMLLRSMLE